MSLMTGVRMQPTPGGVELSLVTEETLELLMARVEAIDGITEQPFGRSIVVVDPDGARIQMNEHNPELYST